MQSFSTSRPKPDELGVWTPPVGLFSFASTISSCLAVFSGIVTLIAFGLSEYNSYSIERALHCSPAKRQYWRRRPWADGPSDRSALSPSPLRPTPGARLAPAGSECQSRLIMRRRLLRFELRRDPPCRIRVHDEGVACVPGDDYNFISLQSCCAASLPCRVGRRGNPHRRRWLHRAGRRLGLDRDPIGGGMTAEAVGFGLERPVLHHRAT
jgi:hypothetical protein